MTACLNPVSRFSSEPGHTVLLDMMLPQFYARFTFPERVRSYDGSVTMRPTCDRRRWLFTPFGRALHLAAQLL
jgi:hypothetical protein